MASLSNYPWVAEGTSFTKRAPTEKLLEIFNKYASATEDGEKYMTSNDFIRGFLGLYKEENYNPAVIKLLGGVIDTSKDGLISFPEFQAFEAILCLPDSLYKTAFQLFDTNGSGFVTVDEFEDVVKQTVLHHRIPFDFESDFVKLYFGKEKKRAVSYSEFSQFLHDFHEEHAIQAFKRFDKKNAGYITALDFLEIMVSIKTHLLTKEVRANLVAAAGGGSGGHLVSFPYFMAFSNLLNNMELVKKIYLSFTKSNISQEVTKEEFLYAAQQISQITPLETDILFQLVDLLHHTGKITFSDLEVIAPERLTKSFFKPFREVKAVQSPDERGVFIQFLESGYRFLLGAIAGATGATAVYPIDLVKTRLQNQRSGSYVGELMYKNSLDCFKKVIRHEGVFGLYRGLIPQLVGVAPEKAIKLTMNDFIRDKLRTEKGQIALSGEILAGAVAGASQVMFTNPIEIVKIRLQVAGEITTASRVSAVTVLKDLGFLGLYKGARACFLRDIPFSAIYFPAYAHTKALFADSEGYNSAGSLLFAAALAGVPAASLVTPADVIKTRLQVQARAGQTTYSGVLDATRKIWREEGGRAFWKGAPGIKNEKHSSVIGHFAIFRTKKIKIRNHFFKKNEILMRPQGSQVKVPVAADVKSDNPDHIGGYKVALSVFSGIETKFGLYLPRFRPVT
uniref:EF-hand domain-containing protein n=1 Tax=Strigamia maritima TaxID=126957 RepID=T1JI93_STRMM